MQRRDHIAVSIAVFVAAALFGLTPSTQAKAATLYFSPSSVQTISGSTFSVGVRVNTAGQSINAAQGSATFDSEKLEVVSISKSGSIFNLWTQDPTFSNSDGTIDFEGGIPNPGYSGSLGLILTVSFRAKASTTVSGSTPVSLISGAILANDGQGTNILSSLGQVSVAISPSITTPSTNQPSPPSAPTNVAGAPSVESSTHPDSTKWYSNANPSFSWTLPSDVTGVSYLITDRSASNPGPKSDGLTDHVSFTNIGDGIHYFHIKFQRNGAWGPIAHYQFNIDTQPPHEFQIEVVGGNQPESDKTPPNISFSTTDDLSGVDHYEVKIGDGGNWTTVSTDQAGKPYQPLFNRAGEQTVYVKAVDKAGNSITSSVSVTVSALAVMSPIAIWFSSIFNGLVNFLSSNGLFLAFLLALIGFIILLYKALHIVVTRGWRRISNRRAIRSAEHHADSGLDKLMKDMQNEIKFLNTIGKRRRLGPEERYLKTKIEQYVKILRRYGR